MAGRPDGLGEPEGERRAQKDADDRVQKAVPSAEGVAGCDLSDLAGYGEDNHLEELDADAGQGTRHAPPAHPLHQLAMVGETHQPILVPSQRQDCDQGGYEGHYPKVPKRGAPRRGWGGGSHFVF